MNTRSEPHLEEKRHTSEVDVNFKDHNDDTPLLLACKKGDIELVKKLIEEKADLNYYNDIKEYDAAVLAYQHKHFDVLALLLSKGYNNIYIFFEVFQENDISMMLKLVDYGYIGEAHLHCLDREKKRRVSKYHFFSCVKK